MTKFKICGLTTCQEAEWFSEEQADYAGMVLFFPKSKRNISVTQAEKIIQALPDEIKSVAVVVSPDTDQIRQLEKAGFDLIQIHGTVLSEVVEALHVPFLRAFNVDNMQEWEIFEQEEKCAGYVFDAVKPGSGETFDWSSLPSLSEDGKPYLLAGGLNPENVGDAIRSLQPYGVDVSSGVESDQGKGKAPEKIKAFAEAVRNADKLL